MADTDLAARATKHQLRLSGGAMSFNTPEDMAALERFIGTDQVIDLTIQGVVSGAGINHNTYTVTFLVADYVLDLDELDETA